MLITLIENKVKELLKEATMTNAETYVVQGIDGWLKPFDEPSNYPRILLAVENIAPTSIESGAVTRDYVANIFLLCYSNTEEEMVNQRDINAERIEETLRGNQRLGNLADNNKEKVFGSAIGETRLVKFGTEDSYHAIAWVEFIVNTERTI